MDCSFQYVAQWTQVLSPAEIQTDDLQDAKQES
jgi:hypothetical protein